MQAWTGYSALANRNGKEIKVGDIIQPQYGTKVFIEEFGSQIVGSFSYRPVGAIAQNHSYPLSDLRKEAPFEIVGTMDLTKILTDKKLEKLWEELKDVTFIEAKDFYVDDEDYKDDISLVLMSDWQEFSAGTDVETIWHWFDRHHTKGVGWLLNEYEY